MNLYNVEVSGYCILEVETGLLDGNYTPATPLKETAKRMKEHWDEQRPNFTHAIIYTEEHIQIPDANFLSYVHRGLIR